MVIHVNYLTVDRRNEGYADCVPRAADCPITDCELKMVVEVNSASKILNYRSRVDIPTYQGSSDNFGRLWTTEERIWSLLTFWTRNEPEFTFIKLEILELIKS